MDSGTLTSHSERIATVAHHIHDHLDEPLDRERLAAMAGFSIVHFQRIFAAHTGESIGAYVRRLRMERAAYQLQAGNHPVIKIALDCGYETHSAFSQAFKQHFGVTPTTFRTLTPTAAAHLASRRIPYTGKGMMIQPIAIRERPDTKVLYARATEVMTAPAFQTAVQEAFATLYAFLQGHRLTHDVKQTVALYPDAVNEGEEVRFDAGVIFPEGIVPEPDATVAYQTLPGGRWAVFLHVGPYDTLWRTWHAAYRDWLPTSGETLRDVACFEDYVDDPSQVAPNALRTEIYLPLA